VSNSRKFVKKQIGGGDFAVTMTPQA